MTFFEPNYHIPRERAAAVVEMENACDSEGFPGAPKEFLKWIHRNYPDLEPPYQGWPT